ncbi:MAG: hypothetical protein JWO32_2965 [Bacteroidetes bacterium]|nr:hypothetical protein [Bacteroidota bacterium]
MNILNHFSSENGFRYSINARAFIFKSQESELDELVSEGYARVSKKGNLLTYLLIKKPIRHDKNKTKEKIELYRRSTHLRVAAFSYREIGMAAPEHTWRNNQTVCPFRYHQCV